MNRWRETWTAARAQEMLGAEYVHSVEAGRTDAESACYWECRAAGAWDANEPELYAAFSALGRSARFRAGLVGP